MPQALLFDRLVGEGEHVSWKYKAKRICLQASFAWQQF